MLDIYDAGNKPEERVSMSTHMKKSTIWISYDLGVRGDYEGLYSWLDSHAAKECGDSVAVLTYAHSGDMAKVLKAELSEAFTIDKRTRVYVVYREQTTNKNKGKFIFGGRRAAAWAGYASSNLDLTDDEV